MANLSSFFVEEESLSVPWSLDEEVELWHSPGVVALSVVVVFALSPVAIGCNALLVISICRFKRLRYPSNCFLLGLATADLGSGLLMPMTLLFEFSRASIDGVFLCLFPICVLILILGVSMLSQTAIALDRYTSLASPLRYNNIVTHKSVGRYIAVFWLYSLLLSTSPLVYGYYEIPNWSTCKCSIDLVPTPVRLFLLFALFFPCTILVVVCYGYVFVVARYHARAIFSVEVGFRAKSETSRESRYGRTLSLLVGFYLCLWSPLVICVLVDTHPTWRLLTGRTPFYLVLMALSNSAVNPWLYGFRSTEFQRAFLGIVEELVPKLGQAIRRRRSSVLISFTGREGMTSCASNIRLVATSPNHTLKTHRNSFKGSTGIMFLAPPETIVELSAGVSSPLLDIPAPSMTVQERSVD